MITSTIILYVVLLFSIHPYCFPFLLPSNSRTNSNDYISIMFPRSLNGIRSNKKSMRLNMVFDFIRKRTEEGIAQVQNIATKTIEGKFVEALSDSAEYIKTRQKIDAENLNRLTAGTLNLKILPDK